MGKNVEKRICFFLECEKLGVLMRKKKSRLLIACVWVWEMSGMSCCSKMWREKTFAGAVDDDFIGMNANMHF